MRLLYFKSPHYLLLKLRSFLRLSILWSFYASEVSSFANFDLSPEF